MENEEYRLNRRNKKRENYRKHAQEIQQRRKQIRLQNLDTALAKEREYGATYRQRHQEEINARNRERYKENLEANRAKNAERQKKYRQCQRFKNETSKIIMPLLSAIVAYKQKQA